MSLPDFYNGKTPKRKNNQSALGSPTMAELRAALTTYNATSYTPERLKIMTRNDLLNAVRVHSLTVNTAIV